jgi:hypothetical protein
MTPATTMIASLPRPYAVAPSSVVAQLLDVLSLELEIAAEDIGRVRLTHWVEQAWTEGDVARLADLVGIDPLAWETIDTFRARLIPLVASRLHGSVGPLEIGRFVFDYLRAAEDALGRPSDRLNAVLVPGLKAIDDPATAFVARPDRPRYRPLQLVENPPRQRSSQGLAATDGRVAHVQHWHDHNGGLFDASPTIRLLGGADGRTSVPILRHGTSGEWIGYRGVVPVGRELLVQGDARGRHARATIDGIDVSERLMSGRTFPPDPRLRPKDLDAEPRLPMVRRGDNEWMYLSAGLFGIRGVDRTFMAFADEVMREASFDDSTFDRAIFPVGPVVTIELTWVEREPASFEVRVPNGVTVEPAGRTPLAGSVAAALGSSIGELRAAGVTAALVLLPFIEVQAHRPSVLLPWIVLPSEGAPTGTSAGFTVGGRFDDTAFGSTLFE